MNFVAYFRVSTKRQGLSGLGLEAQKSLVHNYINSTLDGKLMLEYTEIESGKKDNREQLAQALHHCEMTGATLIVSKLDRLSRDLHFLTSVMKSGIPFICADNPNANNLTLGILAVISQEERLAISARTKAALKAAKERGVKLGNPKLAEIRNTNTTAAINQNRLNANKFNIALLKSIRAIQSQGVSSYAGIARELNNLGIKSRRGSVIHHGTVRDALAKEESWGMYS